MAFDCYDMHMEENRHRGYGAPYDFGLVGFWYTQNYGAALTAYALERTVRAMGYSVLMIDAPGTIYENDSSVYDSSSPARRFISQFCTVSGRQETLYDLQMLNDICDGFLLGSDQLWGWQKGKYRQQGAYYLLDFANADRKKIAYGTSFGKMEFDGDAEDRNAFGFLLGRFSDVSVRERDGVDICREDFKRDATWVVDPVFLPDPEAYLRIGKCGILEENISDEDYIFVYLLQPTKEKSRIIREVAERRNKRVIAVSDMSLDYAQMYPCDQWEFEHYERIEVADWIRLLCHAACVITDSYHGFCFSIIFRKEFLALTPRGGLNRFQTIAEMTGLEDYIDIGGKNRADLENRKPIDYDVVWERLRREVDRSRAWLERALKREQEISPYDRIYDVTRYDRMRMEERLRAELRADFERRLWEERTQYFALCSTLRRQSVIERKCMVKFYLVHKLAGRHIAIRGAGVHTEELLKILGHTGLSILCIWDRESADHFFERYPVIKDIHELRSYGADTILISSWKYREEMAGDVRAQLKENGMEDIEILDFYEQLREEGIPINSEFFWYDWELPT